MVTVTLRRRSGKNGKDYLYLDFYPALFDPKTRKQTRREYLHIALYSKPNGPLEKNYNKKMIEMGEAFRCKRALQISSDELGFYSDSVRNESFLDFFEELALAHNEGWVNAQRRFSEFTNGKCTFGQITVELCDNFKTWLMDDACIYGPMAKKDNHRKISHNNAIKIFIIFRRILKEAFKANKLKTDINLQLETPTYERTTREYLTMKEVRKLWETPCSYGVLKDASMFSIFTGLRISDILSLTWDEVQTAPDGKPCIRKVFQKTGIRETVFISEEALRFCGTRRPGKLVFTDLRRSMTLKPLQTWLKNAGITKHITFHCFRHTNATLMLAGGVDLYTVSGQLTHTSIKTTQIYGHLVDESKRHASEVITLHDRATE